MAEPGLIACGANAENPEGAGTRGFCHKGHGEHVDWRLRGTTEAVVAAGRLWRPGGHVIALARASTATAIPCPAMHCIAAASADTEAGFARHGRSLTVRRASTKMLSQLSVLYSSSNPSAIAHGTLAPARNALRILSAPLWPLCPPCSLWLDKTCRHPPKYTLKKVMSTATRKDYYKCKDRVGSSNTLA